MHRIKDIMFRYLYGLLKKPIDLKIEPLKVIFFSVDRKYYYTLRFLGARHPLWAYDVLSYSSKIVSFVF